MFDKNFDDMQSEEMRKYFMQMNNPYYLYAKSMTDLYDEVYKPKTPVIENLLYSGTYLFVGAPKVGKSFFMAQIAYHISKGVDIWDYKVNKGTVLYLALEDDYARLQRRLYTMFGECENDNLYLATQSHQLNDGLDNNVCLLLVHHTRKQQSDDCFETISGTNGLLGAADGAFLLQKEKRTSPKATLDAVGRDQQDQRLYLEFNRERCIWELIKAENELWTLPDDPILENVSNIVNNENT